MIQSWHQTATYLKAANIWSHIWEEKGERRVLAQGGPTSLCLHKVIYWFDVIDIRCDTMYGYYSLHHHHHQLKVISIWTTVIQKATKCCPLCTRNPNASIWIILSQNSTLHFAAEKSRKTIGVGLKRRIHRYKIQKIQKKWGGDGVGLGRRGARPRWRMHCAETGGGSTTLKRHLHSNTKCTKYKITHLWFLNGSIWHRKHKKTVAKLRMVKAQRSSGLECSQ